MFASDHSSWRLGESVPRGKPLSARLERAQLGLTKAFLILGDRPRAVILHYQGTCHLDRRSYPCVLGHCEGCKNGLRKDWKSYLACWDVTLKRRVLAELTVNAVRALPILDNDLSPDASLRGRRLELIRNGHVRGKVFAKVVEPPPSWKIGHMPEAFDPITALTIVMGVDYLGVGSDNAVNPATPLRGSFAPE